MGILEEVNASYEKLSPVQKRIADGCDGGDHIKVHKEDRGPELRGDEEPSAGASADETGPWGRFEQNRGSCGRDPVR